MIKGERSYPDSQIPGFTAEDKEMFNRLAKGGLVAAALGAISELALPESGLAKHIPDALYILGGFGMTPRATLFGGEIGAKIGSWMDRNISPEAISRRFKK